MITTNSAGGALSTAYATAIQEDSRDFLCHFFFNGSALDCAIAKWTITKGSCGTTEQFEVGDIISSTLIAEVKDLTQDLKNEEIEVRIGLMVGTAYEWLTIGKFFIADIEKTAYTTVLKGYGRTMAKSSGGFAEPSVKTLASIGEMLGIGMGCTVSFDSNIDTSLVVTESMYGITNYQALQILASVVGGYAIDTADGNVKICKFSNTATLSVGAGLMTRLPVVAEQDFSITGLRCIVKEAYTDGETDVPATGYETGTPVNLLLNNKYMTQDLFNGLSLVGYSYRPAEIDLSLGDPRIEGNDVLSVSDVNGNNYTVPCHAVTHSYDGGLRTTIVSARATNLSNAMGMMSPLQRALAGINSSIVRNTTILNETRAIAQDTNQYFWFIEEGGTVPLGVGTGAHITEKPQAEFLADPANGGGNLLARSDGVAVRDGITELAFFGASESQIGADGENRFRTTQSGLSGISADGVEFFDVDLNGASVTTHATGIFQHATPALNPNSEVRDYFYPSVSAPLSVGDVVRISATAITITSSNDSFDPSVRPTVTGRAVIESRSDSTIRFRLVAGNYTMDTTSSLLGGVTITEKGGGTVNVRLLARIIDGKLEITTIAHRYRVTHSGTISVSWGSGIRFEWDYTTTAPAFTFGSRTGDAGTFSVVMGESLSAESANQTIIGKFNEEDTTVAFAIGNGTDTDHRSNAFTVDWTGNAHMGMPNCSVENDIDKLIYDAVVALGWDGSVLE